MLRFYNEDKKYKSMSVLNEIYKSTKHSQLIEESLKDINNIVLEDRHISNEVTHITNLLLTYLEDEIKKTPSLPYNMNGVTYKKVNFSQTIFGIKINFICDYYNIFMKSGTDLNKRTVFDSSPDTKTIVATIVAVNGKMNEQEVSEGIQHELEHLFERGKRGKPYGDEDMYKFASKKMNNALTNYERAVAYVIYISRTYEQRAFVNGAYQYMMRSNDYHNNFDNALKETKLFKWYVGMKECLELFEETPDGHPLLRSALKPYGKLDRNELINLTKETIENMSYLIGRLKSKVIDDYNMSHNIYHFPNEYQSLKNESIVRDNLKIVEQINKKYGLI